MDLKPYARTGEIWVPANGLKAPQVKPATWVPHGISGAWQFANGDDETLVADMRIPIRMNREINPLFGIGWSADGINPGNCEWQLIYNWLEPHDDTTEVVEVITITQVAAASAVRANGMILTIFSDELIRPSEDVVCIQINLKRLADGVLDTITDTVELFGMCLQFAKKEGM